MCPYVRPVVAKCEIIRAGPFHVFNRHGLPFRLLPPYFSRAVFGTRRPESQTAYRRRRGKIIRPPKCDSALKATCFGGLMVSATRSLSTRMTIQWSTHTMAKILTLYVIIITAKDSDLKVQLSCMKCSDAPILASSKTSTFFGVARQLPSARN